MRRRQKPDIVKLEDGTLYDRRSPLGPPVKLPDSWTRKPTKTRHVRRSPNVTPVDLGRSAEVPLGHDRGPSNVTWAPHDHSYFAAAGLPCECGQRGPRCNQCGAVIPETKPRSRNAYAGRGRARSFCGATCRKRWSRR